MIGWLQLVGRRFAARPARPLPWARPKHEAVLVVLVGLVALAPVMSPSAQDTSRICLSEAILHGRLSSDACFRESEDHAVYRGRLYSDKAPGLSLLDLASVAALAPGPPQRWSQIDYRLWGVRVLSVGLAFVLCAWLVGRVAEGIAPRFGGIVLVTFALGTLVAPLASVSFEHVPAAVLAFAAFLFATRRQPALAGLLAGAAVVFDYQCGIAVVVLAAYVALSGTRPFVRYLAGLVPGAVVLGAYDWAAFGAPWRLSYRYLGSYYAALQGQGFFGIGPPHLVGLEAVFAGTGGLFVLSPVLVAAGFGLAGLGRRYPREVAVCVAVAGGFLLLNLGYFEPYGGGSPGPRFLAVALPFLAVGLPAAFVSRPRLTLALAALSVVPMTAQVLTWDNGHALSGSVWVQLARIPADLGSSTFVRALAPTALSALGAGNEWGALAVGAAAATAFLLAAVAIPWQEIRAAALHPARRRPPRPRTVLLAAFGAYLVVTSDVLAFNNYPYGTVPPLPPVVILDTTVTPSTTSINEGGDVNFKITIADAGPIGAGGLSLHITLGPGLRLLGPPAYTLGTGCTGTSTLDCAIGFLTPRNQETATVWLGTQVTQLAPQQLTAYASSSGDPHSQLETVTIMVTS